MISPLAHTCLWTDNISFISEKGWLKKIYKPIKSCCLRESIDVRFFIPQIIQGIYCRRIWLTETFLQKGSTVLRKRWRDMKNIQGIQKSPKRLDKSPNYPTVEMIYSCRDNNGAFITWYSPNYRFSGDRERTKLWDRPACIMLISLKYLHITS